jgi:protein-disulfide isomerase
VAGAIKLKSPSQRAKEQARIQKEEARKRRRTLMLIAGIGGVVAVALLIALGAIGRGGGSGSPSAPPGVTIAGKTLGSDSAPVTITAWEDFQCPYCKQANDGPLAQVINTYVGTGQVKVVYMQFAFLGNGGSKDESMLAAQASECAAEQDQFWPYHDKLFAVQGRENTGVFSSANLKKYAADVGLDQEAFASCLDSGRYKAAVQDELKQGKALGVNSTPTFFVNGTQVFSVQSYSALQDAIEKALKAAGQ